MNFSESEKNELVLIAVFNALVGLGAIMQFDEPLGTIVAVGAIVLCVWVHYFFFRVFHARRRARAAKSERGCRVE